MEWKKGETNELMESPASALLFSADPFLHLCSPSLVWSEHCLGFLILHLHFQCCMHANIIGYTINKWLPCYEEMAGSSTWPSRNVTWSNPVWKSLWGSKLRPQTKVIVILPFFFPVYHAFRFDYHVDAPEVLFSLWLPLFWKTHQCWPWLCSVLARKVQQCEKHSWRRLSLTDLPRLLPRSLGPLPPLSDDMASSVPELQVPPRVR